MQKRITKKAVDQLSTQDGGKTLWDSEVKGFGVRRRASGAKHYVLKMRVDGRQRWMTIGRHGSPWTPERARKEALRLLGQKADGKDPAAERDKKKGVITVEQLAIRFLDDYVADECKPKTAKDYRTVIEQRIIPKLGRYSVTELKRPDVSNFHRQMREHPYQANRSLQVLSKMMNLAEEWGLRPDGTNPCRRVKKFKEEKRRRYLSTDELQRLGNTLADLEATEKMNPFVIAAIRLLILTGARLSEILTLQWKHVDLEASVLRLPDSKTDAKDIYLNAAAVELLRTLPSMQNNPYVIAGGKYGAHLVNLQKPWRRIRAQAGLDDVRIHDLRHSFASVAAASGHSLPIIGALLGHSQPATTARYAHLAADPLQKASDRIGAEIMAAMNRSNR